MRRGLACLAVLAALALPAAAFAATGWLAIPGSYGPKLRATVVEPAVQAVGGGVRVVSCSFQQRHRFYVCVYGTPSAPRKGAIEVERTKRCDYLVLRVRIAGLRKPKVTRHAAFHRCF